MNDLAPPPSPEDAPRALREALTREAAELDLRLAETVGLFEEHRVIGAELEKLRGSRAEERRRALPLLGTTRGAGACRAQWDASRGAGRLRACARCGADVADPKGLDGARVRALLGMRSGALFVRPDGTVMARACPRAARTRAGMVALGLFVLVLFSVMVGHEIEERTPPPVATLQYLSPRSDLGHRPRGTHWVAIAPRAR